MNILQQIVEAKHEEVASLKRKVPLSTVTDTEWFAQSCIPFRSALMKKEFAIIAEVKRASPAAGVIRHNIHPIDIAQEYASAGAAAISVLTDERFFKGSINDLQAIRHKIQLPLLRKDFIIDEYQVFEAKAYGADCILLIAGILDRFQLKDLFDAADELGLECLVELYDEREIDILDLDRMELIGINNRDLRTFTVDINQSIRIAAKLPREITVVSESGIRSSADLKLLCNHGIRSALVGEHLMKAEHPGDALNELLTEFVG